MPILLDKDHIPRRLEAEFILSPTVIDHVLYTGIEPLGGTSDAVGRRLVDLHSHGRYHATYHCAPIVNGDLNGRAWRQSLEQVSFPRGKIDKALACCRWAIENQIRCQFRPGVLAARVTFRDRPNPEDGMTFEISHVEYAPTDLEPLGIAVTQEDARSSRIRVGCKFVADVCDIAQWKLYHSVKRAHPSARLTDQDTLKLLSELRTQCHLMLSLEANS